MMDGTEPTSSFKKKSVFSGRRFEYFLPRRWVQKAEDELGEDPETVFQELQKFREKVKGVTNLKSRMDDCFLLAFLRVRKFNQEKALRTLKRYYEVKKKVPEVFEPLLPSENKIVYEDMDLFKILDEKDTLGRTVAILKLGNLDYSKLTTDIVLRAMFTMLEMVLFDQTIHVSGLVIIGDFTNFGFSQLRFITPKFVKSLCSVVMDTYPLRFKKLHGLNTPFFFDALFRLFRPFLSTKMQKRILPHGRKMTNFDEHIQAEILPTLYGGKVPGFDNRKWMKYAYDMEGALQELPEYGFQPEQSTSR